MTKRCASENTPQSRLSDTKKTGAAKILIASFGVVLVLLLSGCLSLGGGHAVIYSPQAKVAAHADWPAVAWSLVIDKPLASDALDSSSIAVRPAPGELQAYADAQWSDPAPDMLQTTLVQAFEDYLAGRYADAAKIKTPLLAHYGELDTRITSGWPAFDKELTAAHVAHQGYVYTGANHGFHNDTTPRYDEPAAKLAWQRTLDWFNKYLR